MTITKLPRPSVGRIVSYVLDQGPNAGEERPAIIVRVWNGENAAPESAVQLQVFTDGPNDELPAVYWKSSVTQSIDCEPGTYHFPDYKINAPSPESVPG